MANDKKLREDLRDGFVKEIIKALEAFGIDKRDILLIKSNEIAIPKLDAERHERYIKIAISVPTGSRDGDASRRRRCLFSHIWQKYRTAKPFPDNFYGKYFTFRNQ